jgi:hypothetical protein
MRAKKIKIRGLCAIIAFLVMGSLCFADIEPEVSVVVVEPNDPNWTPSDCFELACAKATVYNVLSPVEDINDGGYVFTQILSVSCCLCEADTRNLISNLSPFDSASAVEAMVIDDQNNVYTYEDQFIYLFIDTIPSYSPFAYSPAHIKLDFPLDPNVGCPVWLKEVSWSIKGLFAHAILTAKVPFQASDQWIELLPGYSIMIEEAVLKENEYSYRIKGRYEDPNSRPGSSLILRDGEPEQPIPQYMDMGMTFLDEKGIDVRSYLGSSSGGSHSSYSGSPSGYTRTGRSSCVACGYVKTIQFKFAIDPYIADMFYVLNDIPVPTF